MAANMGIAPPDYTTEIGQVRLATSDTDASNIASGQGEYVWSSDAEITALIAMTGSPQRAALRILRLVAMTPAMQYKKWSSADLAVDGPAITRALRELINDIEKSLNSADDAAASAIFQIVPTGGGVAQPAFLPDAIEYNGREIDPTLPFAI